MGKLKSLLIIVCGLLVFTHTLSAGSVRDSISATYHSQIGVRETDGNNDSKEIRSYLKVTGFHYPVPWCAAFVSWVLTECKVPNPKSAWSPSWFPKSRTIYQYGKGETPRKADVFGLYYRKLKRIGHVGFIDHWGEGNYCITVEGNTNNAGSREGDGVLKKRRLKSQLSKVSSWVKYIQQ